MRPQVQILSPRLDVKTIHHHQQESSVVKSTAENLSPTRVKLTVEVPFEEVKPALDLSLIHI